MGEWGAELGRGFRWGSFRELVCLGLNSECMAGQTALKSSFCIFASKNDRIIFSKYFRLYSCLSIFTVT